MELDLDTFLVTVYCVIDDLYQETFAAHKPVRPGAEPEMSDSEVLTVVVLTQWQQSRSESAFLGYVRHHWRAYFPRVLSQSAFNRRARDLMRVLWALLRWRQAPTAPSPSAADLRPVLGPSHKRGGRVGPRGPLAPRQGVGTASGAPYLADLGFAGQAWQRHWAQDYGARVLTKADYAQGADAQGAARWVASLRQVVETGLHILSARFGLTFPRARTYWGLLT